MKKQFFYAALAIGMMSSCTSSDLPGNQAPEEQLPEEERVAIELGISSPNAKIEAWLNAPPENISSSCIKPPLVKSFIAANWLGSMPGSTT